MTAPARTIESKHSTRLRADAAIAASTAKADPLDYADSDFGMLLIKSRWDVHHFAKEALGVELHSGQDRIALAILMRDESGWMPRNLTICCSAGNRAGKTLGVAISVLHSTFFKMGLKPPSPGSRRDLQRWVQLSYDWYHFAIAQETAELLFLEITRLLAGTHEAQKHGCPLTEMLGAPIATWDKKERSEYLWIKVLDVFGGGQIHFRTTGERAIGSLGKDMNGISYDECAFDPHFDFIVNEVLHMRRLSTGGQLILIGTPTEGLTAFADKWGEGDPDAPDKKPDSFSIRMSTRENIGYGVSRSMFDRLVADMPETLIPQNIDGYFIEGSKAFFSAQSVDSAFIDGLPELAPVRSGHRYVQGVDPALSFDSTWSLVLDTTITGLAVGVSAGRQRGRTTGPTIAALATNQHNAYSVGGGRCQTGIDATGFGGHMFRDLLSIHPLVSVEFGGTRGKKLKLLNTLKLWLERGWLKFPRAGLWLVLRRQLLGYRLDDKGLETDAVMALAVAVSLLNRAAGPTAPTVSFDFFQTGGDRVSSGVPAFGAPRRNASYASLADMRERE